MIYLDHGATSWPKPKGVGQATLYGIRSCGNPGRGGYSLAMEGAKAVYRCREAAAKLFQCQPEQVVCTMNCTHGLNIAIRTLVQPGDRVVISGFEHNAVTRPLHHLQAQVEIAGRRLFRQDDTLEDFERVLRTHPKAAVFTHVSNVFGYILPVEELADLCRHYEVPFIIDAAQSAGSMAVDFQTLGADFIAMPGHKGLQGPMGTGLLLCGRPPVPLMQGGTGSQSIQQEMPEFLPDRGEAGTVNVPGICGLTAGIRYVSCRGAERIGKRETDLGAKAAQGLLNMGLTVFHGPAQGGTVSFLPPDGDCEGAAEKLAQKGVCLRAGIHCAPVAHESAGTLQTGTLRLSCGPETTAWEIQQFLWEAEGVFSGKP